MEFVNVRVLSANTGVYIATVVLFLYTMRVPTAIMRWQSTLFSTCPP